MSLGVRSLPSVKNLLGSIPTLEMESLNHPHHPGNHHLHVLDPLPRGILHNLLAHLKIYIKEYKQISVPTLVMLSKSPFSTFTQLFNFPKISSCVVGCKRVFIFPLSYLQLGIQSIDTWRVTMCEMTSDTDSGLALHLASSGLPTTLLSSTRLPSSSSLPSSFFSTSSFVSSTPPDSG